MGDWTASPRKIKTPTGVIYYGGPCDDTQPNLERYAQGHGNQILTLQRPAMKAFKAAEERYQAKAKKNAVIKVLAGTNRSCATQIALYRSDSSRYAPPQYTGHTRGLAIDVDQGQGSTNLRYIRTALLNEGWKQARSDEPWHYSYHVTI